MYAIPRTPTPYTICTERCQILCTSEFLAKLASSVGRRVYVGHDVVTVEQEVGVCEVIGVISAIFLLPVLAAGASEYDFSAFFDVSAPPCARSSTGDAQSAISGYAPGRR